MKLKNNRSGFTLLEIIIVIIIVGVLASLALPRLFSTIQYSTATEALNFFGTMRRAADTCAMMAGQGVSDWSTCTTWASLNMADPGAQGDARFAYGAGFAWVDPILSITATSLANAADTLIFTYNTTTGTTTRVGAGAFAAINN